MTINEIPRFAHRNLHSLAAPQLPAHSARQIDFNQPVACVMIKGPAHAAKRLNDDDEEDDDDPPR